MEYTEKDYILGTWYAAKENGDSLLLQVKRGEAPDSWEAEYRYRRHNTADPFDGKDNKTFYRYLITNTSEDRIVTVMNQLFKEFTIEFPLDITYVEIKGDIKKMIALLKEHSWAHMKSMDREGNELDQNKTIENILSSA